MYVYFYSLHVSGNHVPIIRRISCIMYRIEIYMKNLCVKLVYLQRLY